MITYKRKKDLESRVLSTEEIKLKQKRGHRNEEAYYPDNNHWVVIVGVTADG